MHAVAESSPALPDVAVLELAVAEDRLLLTEDKDFGEWIFAHQHEMKGVLLIRYPATMRAAMVEAVVDLVGKYGKDLLSSFTVLEPGRARIRKKVVENKP